MDKARIKAVVEDNRKGMGRVFDLAVQALIVTSLVSFSLETLPDLSEAERGVLQRIEAVCIVVFSAEYLLRLWVADRARTFALSFFGLVDLLAILPFYLSLGVDLRSLRILRFLRIFRALKLFRYNQAVRRYHRAFSIARDELVLFGCATLILLFFAGTGIYYFENPVQPEVFSSLFDGLWWAVITLTTVGYGDVVPHTLGGRVFTFLILIIGLGIVAVPTGLLSSALSAARAEEKREQMREKG